MKRRSFLANALKASLIALPSCKTLAMPIYKGLFDSETTNIFYLKEASNVKSYSDECTDPQDHWGQVIGFGEYGTVLIETCIRLGLDTDVSYTSVLFNSIQNHKNPSTNHDWDMYQEFKHLSPFDYENISEQQLSDLLIDKGSRAHITFLVFDGNDERSVTLATTVIEQVRPADTVCICLVIRKSIGISRKSVAQLSNSMATVLDFPYLHYDEWRPILNQSFYVLASILMHGGEYLANYDLCDIRMILLEAGYFRLQSIKDDQPIHFGLLPYQLGTTSPDKFLLHCGLTTAHKRWEEIDTALGDADDGIWVAYKFKDGPGDISKTQLLTVGQYDFLLFGYSGTENLQLMSEAL